MEAVLYASLGLSHKLTLVIGKHGVDITPCASKVGISLFIK